MSQMNQAGVTKYRVRFTGEMLPGFTQESAILSVAKAYSVPPEDVAKWFAKEGVTLRESASKEEIVGLEGFFRQHGLKLSITPIESPVQSVPPALDSTTPEEAVSTAKEHDEAAPQQNHRNAKDHEDHEERVASKDSSQEPSMNDRENPFQRGDRKELSLEELQQTLSQLKVMLLPKDLEGFVAAGLGKRLGAYIIDFLIFVILFQLIMSNILANLGLINLDFINEYVTLFNESGGSLEQMLASPDIEALSMQILKTIGPWYVALYFLYFAVQERYYGATIGKRLFKIRIYSLRTGKNLTWNTVAVRTILFFLGLQFLTSLPLVGIFLFLGTVLWAIRDPLYRRTLYDMVTGTVVGSIASDK